MIDLREAFITAIYVAVILAALRWALGKVPGPVGRLGAFL